MHTLPTGTVTFLFTDIEGSTRLLGELGDRYAALLAEHRRGTGYTTLEIKVNFLRPLSRDTGELTCEGRTVYMGSRIAVAEGRILDETERLYAYAASTCLIFAQAG